MAETADYTLDTDRQSRLVRPLAFDLLDGEQADHARNRLIQALENYGWRLGTGLRKRMSGAAVVGADREYVEKTQLLRKC